MSAPPLGRTELAALRAAHPAVFALSPRERTARALGWAVLLGLTGYCLWRFGFLDFARLWTGSAKLGDVVALMWPPSSGAAFAEFLYGLAETLAMAFLGTLLATLAAIPLGFLGARNVLPHWLAHFVLRRAFDSLRGVDQLIWALVFVNVVGLSPFAGILAIFMSDTGTLAKMYAEAIENVDRRPVEGVRAAGASGLQVLRFGMLPQVAPVIISQSLYCFESNTRSATILGVVGAGGIGLQLADRIRVNNWDEAAFIILMILVTVAVIDHLSRRLRIAIIGERA